MTLREFFRVVEVRTEERRRREESEWLRTAAQTAYLYNVTGQAWFKGFKPITAGDIFERWMGKAEPEETDAEKRQRFEAVHDELTKRDTWT